MRWCWARRERKKGKKRKKLDIFSKKREKASNPANVDLNEKMILLSKSILWVRSLKEEGTATLSLFCGQQTAGFYLVCSSVSLLWWSVFFLILDLSVRLFCLSVFVCLPVLLCSPFLAMHSSILLSSFCPPSVLLLSSFCPPFVLLSSFCPPSVLLLSSFCPPSVLLLSSFCLCYCPCLWYCLLLRSFLILLCPSQSFFLSSFCSVCLFVRPFCFFISFFFES